MSEWWKTETGALINSAWVTTLVPVKANNRKFYISALVRNPDGGTSHILEGVWHSDAEVERAISELIRPSHTQIPGR